MAAVRDRIESLSFQEILKAKDSKLKLKYLAPQHRLTTTTDMTTDIHYTHYTVHYTHYTSNYARLCSIMLTMCSRIQHIQKHIQHIQERVNVYARPQVHPLMPHTTFLIPCDFS